MARLKMQPSNRLMGENSLALTLNSAEFKSIFKVFPRANQTAFKARGDIDPLDLILYAEGGGKPFRSSSFGYVLNIDPFELGIDHHTMIDLDVTVQVDKDVRILVEDKDITLAILEMAKEGFSISEFEKRFAGRKNREHLAQLRRDKKIVLIGRRYRLPEEISSSDSPLVAETDLTSISSMLMDHPMTLKELSAATGLPYSRVSKIMDHLKKRGQVEKFGQKWRDRSDTIEFMLRAAGGKGMTKAQIASLPNAAKARRDLAQLVSDKKVVVFQTLYRWANRFDWHEEL